MLMVQGCLRFLYVTLREAYVSPLRLHPTDLGQVLSFQQIEKGR